MSTGGPVLTFRPLEADDLRLLWRWLNEPHVRETYGLGQTTTTSDVEREYGPLVSGTDPTRAYVIVVGTTPAGYLQAYRILDDPEYAREVGVADESYGLDLFLGDPRLIGRGIGPRAIRQFADEVLFGQTDAVAIVCDPPSSNRRSVRALEKAGFRRWRSVVPGRPGCGDLLMRLDRPADAPRV